MLLEVLMKSPELLSPAGSLKSMRCAFAYGADAVYAGQPRYSLRARNNEFTHENLVLGINEAHQQNKLFFVASNIISPNGKVNTYLKDLEQVIDFIDEVDMFLFDSSSGGSGKSFDFNILQNFSCEKDWFLSGGLNSDNILEALKITGAKLCDISSGIEIIRGEKSPALIKEFMTKIKNVG